MVQSAHGMALDSSRVPRARRVGGRSRARFRAGYLLPVLFVISLTWPTVYTFAVGSVVLTPYRVLLLGGMFYVATQILRGRLRFLAADYLVLMFASGLAVTIVAHHGLFSAFYPDTTRFPVESVGYEAVVVGIIETAGAYFLARTLVTGPSVFEAVMKTFGWAVAVICIFAVVEAVTGKNAFGIYEGAGIGEVRLGLHRAAGPFPHTILWGVFAAVPFAYFAMRTLAERRIQPAFFAFASVVGVITAVSSTGFLTLLVQGFAIGWSRIARIPRKWLIFTLLFAAAYFAVDLISNRTGAEVIVARASLSAETGYTRINQWDYGLGNVAQSPLIGIGFAEWTRPPWLSASIDSYWLVLLVRHGVLVTLLLVLTLAALLRQASKSYRHPDATPRGRLLIRVWAYTAMSLAVAGLAVHYWNQSVVLVFFFLGSLAGAAAPEFAPVRAVPPRARRAAPDRLVNQET